MRASKAPLRWRRAPACTRNGDTVGWGSVRDVPEVALHPIGRRRRSRRDLWRQHVAQPAPELLRHALQLADGVCGVRQRQSETRPASAPGREVGTERPLPCGGCPSTKTHTLEERRGGEPVGHAPSAAGRQGTYARRSALGGRHHSCTPGLKVGSVPSLLQPMDGTRLRKKQRHPTVSGEELTTAFRGETHGESDDASVARSQDQRVH